MATRDTIPAIRPDKEFPLGSLVDLGKQAEAEMWLNAVENLSQNEFIRRVYESSKPIIRTITSPSAKIHNASLALCGAWDSTMNAGGTRYFEYAQNGYRVVRAFNNDTHYLPTYTGDLYLEVRQMLNPEEQLHRAREFGHAAWQGMQAYRDIHNTFDRLLDHSETRFKFYSDDHREFFRAGMALPYMVAMAADLEINTPQYTRLSNYDKNGQPLSLNGSEFERFFTL